MKLRLEVRDYWSDVSRMQCDKGFRTYLLLWCVMPTPTPRPTAKATMITRTTKNIMQILFQPPLCATYALFRRSSNFSPFGPVTSKKVYLGGSCPLAYRGGSPKNLRLNGRWCVFAGNGRGGEGRSSSMMGSLVSREEAREFRLLPRPPPLERRADCGRESKFGEPTKSMTAVRSVSNLQTYVIW